MRAFFDAYEAAIQLGVLPARGTRSEKALLLLRGFGLRARSGRLARHGQRAVMPGWIVQT